MSCSSNSVDDRNCRFLLDISVNETINLNFPEFSQLKSINVPVHIPLIGGKDGIIVNNTGSRYVAFDATDPNHIPTDCSFLSINGIIAKCNCEDGNEYSLLDGIPVGNTGTTCALRGYIAQRNGDDLSIFN
ncbi:hypothetical protein GCM10023311_11680 [Flaviramulus aquimarinus]|uniref:Uncharacterized protein n=2 Tax=Flaviramulus aquimarinus TaxID=1170456 RepID=A0ABP9EZD8_9FLAO